MIIDIEKNKIYYANKSKCECDYCKYFYTHFKLAYPKISEYLESFGIDPTCPHELVWFVDEKEKAICYTNCMYVVIGTNIQIDEKIEGISITLEKENYPNVNLTSEYAVIDFGPIFLDSEYALYKTDEKSKLEKSKLEKSKF